MRRMASDVGLRIPAGLIRLRAQMDARDLLPGNQAGIAGTGITGTRRITGISNSRNKYRVPPIQTA